MVLFISFAKELDVTRKPCWGSARTSPAAALQPWSLLQLQTSLPLQSPALWTHGICHMISPWLQNYAATSGYCGVGLLF